MSKSNKEKERLKNIKLFEQNLIPFDISMLKLKINFYDVNFNKFNINKRKRKINDTKILVNEHNKNDLKYLISLLIKKYLSHLKIYDLEVKFRMITIKSHTGVEIKNITTFGIYLYKNNDLLCSISSRNEPYSKEQDNDQIININDTISDFALNFNNIYENPLITVEYNGFKIKKHAICKLEFKKFTFYKNIYYFLDYIEKYKSLFKIYDYHVNYNLSSNMLQTVIITNEKSQRFYGSSIKPATKNIEILHTLKEIKYITFDISDYEENEILEMYELLNY